MQHPDNLTLVPVRDNDLQQIETWLHNDHIKKWFEIPEHDIYLKDWIDEVSKRNDEYIWIHYFMLQEEDKPIGFALYYDCWDAREEWYNVAAPDETYSIDYLIGELSYTGKGYGKKMIRLLIEKIRQNSNVKRIIVQPDIRNLSSCGVLVSNGFTFDSDKNYFILEINS